MQRDYFAELFVAGLFVDAGWNVYFPHRDKGFDFIVSKNVKGKEVIRAVQVKGKYPTVGKKSKPKYGYVGKLSKLHRDMILVIPYFDSRKQDGASLVAFMPRKTIKPHSRGYRCEPAILKNGEVHPRREYKKYFDKKGMKAFG